MFDQWCDEHDIHGNFREALYHFVLGTREGNAIDDPVEWEKALKELEKENIQRAKKKMITEFANQPYRLN